MKEFCGAMQRQGLQSMSLHRGSQPGVHLGLAMKGKKYLY